MARRLNYHQPSPPASDAVAELGLQEAVWQILKLWKMYFVPFPAEYNNSTKDDLIVLAEHEAHILKTALIQKSHKLLMF